VALQQLGQRSPVALAGSVDEQWVAQLAACRMTLHDTPWSSPAPGRLPSCGARQALVPSKPAHLPHLVELVVRTEAQRSLPERLRDRRWSLLGECASL
jgi:hypothetical protein